MGKDKGWEVVNNKHLNLTHDAMRRVFMNWLDTVEEGDECYFHFSGHGVCTSDNTRWILPSDAELGRRHRLTKIYAVDFFQDELNKKNRSGYKIFGLDCCANRPSGSVPPVTKPRGLENTYIVGYDGRTQAQAGSDDHIQIGYLTMAVRDTFDYKVLDGHALSPGELGNEVFAQAKKIIGFQPTDSAPAQPGYEYSGDIVG